MTTSNKPPSSPLDPAMTAFLAYVASERRGFAAGSQSKDAAQSTDLPEALIDAVFISARTRGLIAPDYESRGRTRWVISGKGKDFLAQHAATEPADSSVGELSDDN